MLGWGGVGETVPGGWVSGSAQGGGWRGWMLILFSGGTCSLPPSQHPANHTHTGPASQEVGTLTAQAFRRVEHPSGLRSGYPVP